MNVKNPLRSVKNDNVYTVYEDKIVVQAGAKIREILFPAAPSGQSNLREYGVRNFYIYKFNSVFFASGW